MRGTASKSFWCQGVGAALRGPRPSEQDFIRTRILSLAGGNALRQRFLYHSSAKSSKATKRRYELHWRIQTGTALSDEVNRHNDGFSSKAFFSTFQNASQQNSHSPCFDDDTFRTTAATVPDDGSSVTVTFEDGTESLFHAVWLWTNDSNCIHASSGQRTRAPSTFYQGWKIHHARTILDDATSACYLTESGKPDDSMNRRPFVPPPPNSLLPVGTVYNSESTSTTRTSRGILEVTWRKGTVHQSPETMVTSFYDMDWLWRCRYDPAALEERTRFTIIDKTVALTSGTASPASSSSPILEIDFASVMTHDECCYQALHAIFEQGAVLIHGAPETFVAENETSLSTSPEPSVGVLGRRLCSGRLSHGHLYDDIFYVKAVHNANNIAYTSTPLPPHQDLGYYQSQPGLQLLHCVLNNGIIGGESTLIDAMAAATEFRRLAPDLFHTLCQSQATFIKQRHNADFVYRAPHITADADGMVVGIRWSPPFEGPVCLAPHQVNDYFVAASTFELMLDNHAVPSGQTLEHLPISSDLEQALRRYAHEYTWERQLMPGEVLVFNNQRMLHGRRGFDFEKKKDEGGERSTAELLEQPQRGRVLVGCYTNMEETASHYRLLRRRQLHSTKDRVYQRNAGNCSGGAT